MWYNELMDMLKNSPWAQKASKGTTLGYWVTKTFNNNFAVVCLNKGDSFEDCILSVTADSTPMFWQGTFEGICDPVTQPKFIHTEGIVKDWHPVSDVYTQYPKKM